MKEVTFDRKGEHKKDVSEAIILADDRKKMMVKRLIMESLKKEISVEVCVLLRKAKKVTKKQICIEQVIQKR